jgi:hypothetical protein
MGSSASGRLNRQEFDIAHQLLSAARSMLAAKKGVSPWLCAMGAGWRCAALSEAAL